MKSLLRLFPRLHANKASVTPGLFRAASTSEQEATQRLLEILRQGKRKEILRWLRTPRSTVALCKCEASGLTPHQVANPETLLPRATRLFLWLAEWFRRTGYRIGKARAKRFADYDAALAIAQGIEVENQTFLQRVAAMQQARQNHAAH